MIEKHHKLALYMEGAIGEMAAKMGSGCLRYSPNEIVAVIDSRFAGRDVADVSDSARSCPVVADVDAAAALGADVLVLGIAPPGGLIPKEWYPDLDRAVSLGLSLVNGLHDLLGPRYPALCEGQFVWDIRVEPPGLDIAHGEARNLTNTRVLMIGTDMSCGKMTAGLEIWKTARERGMDARFVATGQIGIVVTGSGVPLDAIRVDFAGGAIEREVLKGKHADMVIVEGQGSLIHPASTANLPLLRGTMPTHLVLCHRAGAETLRRVPWVKIPPLRQLATLYEDLAEACGTFPRPKTAAICLNTGGLSEEEAREHIERTERETGLPATDPVRTGVQRVLEAVLE
ncbi:MAG: DUF1611 domain-containing protein [Armatimonadetes bacterium]|nr:DUF1611 domain-containing protein [Armatimonadota bacterium]